MHTTWNRWLIGTIVALCIIALLAWARNNPGIDDRDPDPPQSTEIVTDEEPVAPDVTTVIDAGTVPPTT